MAILGLAAVGVTLTGILALAVKRALRQKYAWEVFDASQKELHTRELSYANALGLACDNFHLSSAIVTDHLNQIQNNLQDRRDALERAQIKLSAGRWSAELGTVLTELTWAETVDHRLREIQQHFINAKKQSTMAMQYVPPHGILGTVQELSASPRKTQKRNRVVVESAFPARLRKVA